MNNIIYLLPFVIFAPNAIINITITLMLFVFCTNIYRTKEIEIFQQRWFYLAIIFSSYLAINSAINCYSEMNILHALAWLRYPLLSLAIFYFLKQNKMYDRYFKILKYISFFIIIDALIQYIFKVDLLGKRIIIDGTRLTIISGKPNAGDHIFTMFLPIFAIYTSKLFAKRSSILNIIGYVTYILSFIAIIVLCGERVTAGWALLCSFIIIAINIGINKKLNFKTLIASTVCLTGLFAIIITQTSVQKRIKTTIANLSDFRKSPYGIIMDVSIDAVNQYPVFGLGSKNYRNFSPNSKESYRMDEINHPHAIHPHNIHFEIMTEAGIVGYFIFILLILQIIYDMFKAVSKNYLGYIKNPVFLANSLIIFSKLFPVNITGSFWNASTFASLWITIGINYYIIFLNQDARKN